MTGGTPPPPPRPWGLAWPGEQGESSVSQPSPSPPAQEPQPALLQARCPSHSLPPPSGAPPPAGGCRGGPGDRARPAAPATAVTRPISVLFLHTSPSLLVASFSFPFSPLPFSRHPQLACTCAFSPLAPSLHPLLCFAPSPPLLFFCASPLGLFLSVSPPGPSLSVCLFTLCPFSCDCQSLASLLCVSFHLFSASFPGLVCLNPPPNSPLSSSVCPSSPCLTSLSPCPAIPVSLTLCLSLPPPSAACQSLLIPGKSASRFGRRGSAIGIGTVEEVVVRGATGSGGCLHALFSARSQDGGHIGDVAPRPPTPQPRGQARGPGGMECQQL